MRTVPLLLSNGHSPLLPGYLQPATGPQLEGAIQGAGFTVETSYFTDDATSYLAFVPKLQSVRAVPEGAYSLGVQRTCSGVPSASGAHDLEDVVFPHVVQGYEVRSGDVLPNPLNPLQLIEYDERWNARTDGRASIIRRG